MQDEHLVFRIHAIQRMYQRRVTEEDVRHVLSFGEVIEDYPDDEPYPSQLVLGWCGGRPLHVVMAYNRMSQEKIVISVYEPDSEKWHSDFRRRKP